MMSPNAIFYYNECPIIIASSSASIAVPEGYQLMEGVSPLDFVTLLHRMEDKQLVGAIILVEDMPSFLEQMQPVMSVMRAGGGLVVNEDQQILMIFRKGKWDLPKGNQDPGEAIEACALREVIEETGVAPLQLGAPLQVTYHLYVEKGKLILKESHWYTMHSSHKGLLLPQIEEQITEAKWVNEEDVQGLLSNSYKAIKDVFTKYLEQKAM